MPTTLERPQASTADVAKAFNLPPLPAPPEPAAAAANPAPPAGLGAQWLDKHQLATELGIKVRALDYRVAAGTLPKPFRNGHRMMWLRSHLLAWFESQALAAGKKRSR